MTRPARRREQRFHLVDGMVLIAGLAVSLSLFGQILKEAWGRLVAGGGGSGSEPFLGGIDGFLMTLLVVVLGGVSFAGVPLLLVERFRRPRPPWSEGKTLWFANGVSSWLLWPPVVALRATGRSADVGRSTSEMCWFYGTPLMAVYVTLALLTGGRLRRSRRRVMKRSWRERFGLFVGLAWAMTGLYLLAMFYRIDLFRR